MTVNLLPCPFCNHIDIETQLTYDHAWCVICGHCDAMVVDRHTEAEAIALWNTRVNSALQAQIDALMVERDAWQRQAHYYADLSLQACTRLDAIDSTWYSSADELTDIGLTYRELDAALTKVSDD